MSHKIRPFGLIPFFMLAHCGHHLLTALLVPVLPFIRGEFALDYTQAGWLVSALIVPYGISQLLGGWLADRIGRRVVITISISGGALFGLLVGLSPTYITMVIFLVLLGVVTGGYHPTSTPLLSASVEPKNWGRVLGLHQIGGNASFFLAPLIVAGIAATLGWRGLFIVLTIPTIVFGIVFYILLGRWRYVKTEIPNHTEILHAPYHLQRLVLFLILSIAGDILILSTISFIPLFIVDHFDVAEGVAAALLAVVYSAGLWVGPLGGYLSDRLGRVPVLIVASFFAGPIIYLLNFVPFGWSSAILIAIGIFACIRMPVSEAYIMEHTSEHNRSTILGIYYFGSRGGPGIVIPAIGYFIDHFGFYVSFTIVGATLVAMTLGCSIFLWGAGSARGN